MNVVIITSHDMGRHLGCYGVPTVQTPHLDAFAAENARFANSWCVAPQCSPSRATIFTGRYPHSNGVMGLAQPGFGWGYHDDERHIAHILSERGYTTALFGFQHETNSTQWIGFDRLPSKHGGPASQVSGDFAEWVATAARAPFYAEIAFVEPHRHFNMFDTKPDTELGVTIPPYLVDEPSAHVEFAGFQGMCKAVDAGYGRVIQSIKDAGLYDETIIVATTDHGIPFPRAKCSVYDPGLEVFSIWHVPGTSAAVIDDPVSNVDYVPTLLDLLGLPAESKVQGRSLANVLRGRPQQRRTEIFAEMTYHDYCDPRRAIRTDTHKLIANFTTAPWFMNPSQTWRPGTITRHPAEPTALYHPPIELFDLQADPLEEYNLADEPEHADIKADLLARLKRWMDETGDPIRDGIPTSPLFHQAMQQLGY